MSALKDRLRSAREAANISQKQLAERVGVAQQTISGLELGLAEDSTKLPEIAKVLRVRLEWLKSGAGPMSAVAPVPANYAPSDLVAAIQRLPKEEQVEVISLLLHGIVERQK